MTKLLQKIFFIGNIDYHKVIVLFGIKFKFYNILNFFKNNQQYYKMLNKRYFERNALVQIRGIYGYLTKKIPFYLNDEIKAFYTLKEKIDFFFFNKVNIPQIEFTLTTKCTLKCKNCINYIPLLEQDEHIKMDFEEFKEYLDNLCASVNKIYNLLLIGGETLLVKDLHKYLEYTAKKKQIKNVWIVTNGTLLMNDDLINTIKKYKKKTVIWLSNYSANEELKDVLKHEKLIEQIKQTKSGFVFNESFKWDYNNENIIDYKRTEKENIEYFQRCFEPCVAVFQDKLFPCPKAGVFYLKKLYQFAETSGGGEFVSLKNPDHRKLKKQIIEFYYKDQYKACNWCSRLQDCKKPKVIPALQIKE